MSLLNMKRRSKLAFFNDFWVFRCEVFEEVLPSISVDISTCELYISEVIFAIFRKPDDEVWSLKDYFACIF
jgi:hypothetical protein